MEKEGIIYLLSDPVTNEPKYIGMTINLENRYKQHLTSKTKDLKSVWIRELVAKSMKPTVTVLEVCDHFMAPAREHFYIRKYRSDGYAILNNPSGNTTETMGTSFELRPDLKCRLQHSAHNAGITTCEMLNFILDEYFNN